MEEIDTTLLALNDGWQQTKSSYQSLFPTFADEWIEFRDMFEGKDQLLRIKPIAVHVKGQLVVEGSPWSGKQVSPLGKVSNQST